MVHIANKNNRGKYSNAACGVFIPQHPEKYIGVEKPQYKSALELQFMMYVDRNPAIVSWGYEGTTIKYYDKSRGRVRRYFIDFTMVIKVGPLRKTIWVEIKPDSETHPPKGRARNDPKAQMTWMTNQCKWESAKALAKSKGYEFHVITEKHMNNGK
ncbi:MAG: hypothetical protein J6W16_03160 [Methanobrevibacter sp.]|nr:hypothetical protein [Methanobrevibacter sp.]